MGSPAATLVRPPLPQPPLQSSLPSPSPSSSVSLAATPHLLPSSRCFRAAGPLFGAAAFSQPRRAWAFPPRRPPSHPGRGPTVEAPLVSSVSVVAPPLPVVPPVVQGGRSYLQAVCGSWPSTAALSDPLRPSARGAGLGPAPEPMLRPRSHSVVEGVPEVSFDEEDVEVLSSPLRLALIGKMPHTRPPMERLRRAFAELNFVGPVSLGLIDSRHVLIRPSLEVDYLRLRSRSLWFVASAPMRVFRWSPDFSTLIDSPLAPVWVSFPDLPSLLFAKASVFVIASCLGTPLKLDKATETLARPSRARVLVEMDISKPLIDNVRIKLPKERILHQQVEYEQFPAYCSVCSLQGHSLATCKLSQERATGRAIEKGKGVSADPSPDPSVAQGYSRNVDVGSSLAGHVSCELLGPILLTGGISAGDALPPFDCASAPCGGEGHLATELVVAGGTRYEEMERPRHADKVGSPLREPATVPSLDVPPTQSEPMVASSAGPSISGIRSTVASTGCAMFAAHPLSPRSAPEPSRDGSGSEGPQSPIVAPPMYPFAASEGPSPSSRSSWADEVEAELAKSTMSADSTVRSPLDDGTKLVGGLGSSLPPAGGFSGSGFGAVEEGDGARTTGSEPIKAVGEGLGRAELGPVTGATVRQQEGASQGGQEFKKCKNPNRVIPQHIMSLRPSSSTRSRKPARYRH